MLHVEFVGQKSNNSQRETDGIKYIYQDTKKVNTIMLNIQMKAWEKTRSNKRINSQKSMK